MPKEIQNALGHVTSFDYDARGLLIRREDPNGLVTTYRYNPQGLLDTLTETPPSESPGGVRITTFSYDAAGQLTETTTPDGVILRYTYDPRGRVIAIENQLNERIAFTYDEAGNVLETDTHDPDGTLVRTLAEVYDNRDRLIETRAPHLPGEDSVTKRTLDANDNLIALLDPNGHLTRNVYDPVDRPFRSTDPENGRTEYTYDTNDRLTEVRAPNGVLTRYTYDVLGRVQSETSPDRGSITYSYDLANNLTRMTDARGITVIYAYDALDRMISLRFPDPGEDVTYTYDGCPFGLGRLCGRIDESGQYAYAYDAFGNVIEMIRTELGIPYITSYEYDEGDRIIAMTLPTGRAVAYTRDGVRRIERIETSIDGTPTPVLASSTYQADNQITARSYGNGLIETRTYDLQGRLEGQTLNRPSGLLEERNYAYDATGNLTGRNRQAENRTYLYDGLDRLVQEALDGSPTPPTDYAYDPNGNRLERTMGPDLDDTYTFTPGANRLALLETLQRGSTPPPPAHPNREYRYNQAGRLFELIENGLLQARYTYNAEGQRTRKVLFNGGTLPTATILYHYDQSGRLLAETREDGTALRDYLWQDDEPLAQIDTSAGFETLLYLHTDHLKTPRLATGTGGAILWRWEGEAFGSAAPEPASATINLRFPGQYFDAETGLHYNYFRDYDPSLGRYITADPISVGEHVQRAFIGHRITGAPIAPVDQLDVEERNLSDISDLVQANNLETVPVELNSYAYAVNNPLRWTDPTGERAGGLMCGTDDKEKNCAALRDNIINQTCKSIKNPRKKFACFAAAWATYLACLAQD